MNNAGMDGQSTFGHIKVIPQLLLEYRPQMILFLVGCNDVLNDSARFYDATKSQTHFMTYLYKHSYLYRVASNLFITYRNKYYQKEFKVYHQNLDFAKMGTLEVDTLFKEQKIKSLKNHFLPDYKRRLLKLIAICNMNNCQPVFMTQPCVLGNVTDSTTGINLGKLRIDDCNGDLYWSMLQEYNAALKDVCTKTQTYCIDLGDSMPKNTCYFYDYFHFTNKGSQLIASIILPSLNNIIEQRRHLWTTKKQALR